MENGKTTQLVGDFWSTEFSTGGYGWGGVGGGGRQKKEVICFGSYNIWNSHNSGHDSVLHRMYQDNIDQGIIQETNSTSGVNMWSLAGFYMVEMETTSRHCSGVKIFYKD